MIINPTSTLTKVRSKFIPLLQNQPVANRHLSSETLALKAQRMQNWLKLDADARASLTRRINTAARNDWRVYVSDIVSKMAAAAAVNDEKRIHYLARYLEEKGALDKQTSHLTYTVDQLVLGGVSRSKVPSTDKRCPGAANQHPSWLSWS